MEYIDLLQIHRFDKNTPIEETMEALHDLVKSGKVRYIGASSMWTYQFVMMQALAEKRGWTKFVSMQNHYNLLYREEEREMNKYCKETGVGLIPVRFSYSLPASSKDTGCATSHVGQSVDADFMIPHSGRLSAAAISPGHSRTLGIRYDPHLRGNGDLSPRGPPRPTRKSSNACRIWRRGKAGR